MIALLSRAASVFRSGFSRLKESVPPLAKLAFAAVIGLFAAHILGLAVTPWVWVTGLAGAVIVFARHPNFWSLAVFFGIGYGMLHAITLTELEQIPHRRAMLAGQRFDMTATGVIVDAPRKLSEGNYRFPMRLESIGSRQLDRRKCDARVQVTLVLAQRTPAYGDRLEISGTLSYPDPVSNPGQFDVRAWYQRQRISAEMIGSEEATNLIDQNCGNFLMATALKSRAWIRDRLTVGIEDAPDIASVVAAMVLGTRSETPEEIEQAFIGSGTMHIFAVSGLHVGLFAYMAWMFLKAFGLRRPVAILMIIPAIVFYAFVTGLRPSACRATIMASILLIGYLCDRTPSMLNSLGAAALAILFTNTLQIFQPGFQLSFVVLGAIVAIAPPINRYIKNASKPDAFLPRSLYSLKQKAVSWVGSHIAGIVSVSCAAWLGSALLVLYHFEIATPIAIVANCFLVPSAFVVLFTASVSLMLGLLGGDWLGILCNNTNWVTTKCTIWLATVFAGLTGGGFRTSSVPGSAHSLHATVLNLDEGGGSAHLAVNGGAQWLIDSGHSSDFGGVILPYLEFRNVDSVDRLALSHGDSGHIGGAPSVIEQTAPRKLVVSGLSLGSRSLKQIVGSGNVLDSRIETVGAGDEIQIGHGTVARILFPPLDGRSIALADDRALVIQVEHLGWRLLFMHDAGFMTEKWLLANCNQLESDILIKGRHRTDYSGLIEFIDAVDPVVIVSTNAAFPAPERIPVNWRAMVERRGIQLFDQAATGAVSILIEPDELIVTPFLKNRSRYVVEKR